MSIVDFLKGQIEGSGSQLTNVLNGIAAEHKDFRLHDGGFSFAEQVTHLAEAYRAVLAAGDGKEYEWGSFVPASDEWSDLVAEAMALRTEATAVVLVDDETKLQLGSDYIVFHDLYHVGQMATMRLQVQADWNYMEIYS
jgi:hypothetical protein